MDRMEDSGSFDLGSNPGGVTKSLHINDVQALFFILIFSHLKRAYSPLVFLN
jgi:hypothetical protein